MQTQLPFLDNLPGKELTGKVMAKTPPKSDEAGSFQEAESFLAALNELTTDPSAAEETESRPFFLETIPELDGDENPGRLEGAGEAIVPDEMSMTTTEPAADGLYPAIPEAAPERLEADGMYSTQKRPLAGKGPFVAKPADGGTSAPSVSPDMDPRGLKSSAGTPQAHQPASYDSGLGEHAEKEPVSSAAGKAGAGRIPKDAGSMDMPKGAEPGDAGKGGGTPAARAGTQPQAPLSPESIATDPNQGLQAAAKVKMTDSVKPHDRPHQLPVSEKGSEGGEPRDPIMDRSVEAPTDADTAKHQFSRPGWISPKEIGADAASTAMVKESAASESNSGSTFQAATQAAAEAKSVQPGAASNDTQWQPRTAQGDLMSQIVDRAVMTLKRGQSEMKLLLKPELLGNLRMRVITENHHVTVRIIAETPVVREVIESNLGQLKSDLHNSGLEVDAFDVKTSADSHREGQHSRHLNPFGTPKGRKSERAPDESGEETDSMTGDVHRDGTAGGIDYFA